MLPDLLSTSTLVALGGGERGHPHSNFNVNTASVQCLDHQKPAKA